MFRDIVPVAGVAIAASLFFASNPAHADWSGYYAGVHTGFVSSNTKWKWNQPGDYATSAGETFSDRLNGLAAGGQVGYQHQWGNWVAGIELAATAGQQKDETASPTTSGVVLKTQIDWFATAAAKFGYARDNFLLYGLAGYAGADIHIAPEKPAISDFSNKKWQSGFLVGAGVDYLLTEHIVLGAQYEYLSLAKMERSGTGSYQTGGSTGVSESIDIKSNIQLVSARVSWKF